MDWKDALASLSGLPDADSPAENSNAGMADSSLTESDKRKQAAPKRETLHVVVEKKGRGGKTATIVEGFKCSDEEIDDIARALRKKLGTGGSARGGEILIQGDRRDDVARMLREFGFKVN